MLLHLASIDILFWLPDGLLLLQHFSIAALHLIIPLLLPDEILIQLLFHRYIRGQTFFMGSLSAGVVVVGGGDLHTEFHSVERNQALYNSFSEGCGSPPSVAAP